MLPRTARGDPAGRSSVMKSGGPGWSFSYRHREPPQGGVAIQPPLDCFVAARLAMTSRGDSSRTHHAPVSRMQAYRGIERAPPSPPLGAPPAAMLRRSEEHTSELQSLMRNSYAVFCLNKKHK